MISSDTRRWTTFRRTVERTKTLLRKEEKLCWLYSYRETAAITRRCARSRTRLILSGNTILLLLLLLREETKRLTTKIEWYAMDFKEELSAFDADAMERQVESTRWVLEEYFGRKIFESDEDDDDDDGGKYLKNVIVVGHSMGGLVAKYAAEQVIVNKSKLNGRRIEHVHVTTLATPHAYHPGAFGAEVSPITQRAEKNIEEDDD